MFVADAITSALEQTYKNIEVVVVNDGSTDNSDEVIRQFGDRIVYINQQNAGASVARNNGIKMSTGNFILNLDGDDWINPQYVEDALKLIDGDHTIVSTQCVFADKDLNVLEGSEWPTDQFINCYNGKINFNHILRYTVIPATGLFSKRLWERCGGYDPLIPGNEDWEFWINMVKHGGTIKYLINNTTPYYKWRRHGPSKVDISSKRMKEIYNYIIKKHFYKNASRYDVINCMYKSFLSREIDKNAIKSYVNCAIPYSDIRDILLRCDEYNKKNIRRGGF
jgi:glycosyltransferase involved in cell wall biosynthesis